METFAHDKYLLSETALEIWKTNDLEKQNNMLLCITIHYKEKWLKTMVYKSKIIPAFRLEEIFEESFYTSWQRFNDNGKAGKIKFTELTYTPYLKQAVHRTFIKLYKKEIWEREQLKIYTDQNAISNQQDKLTDNDDFLKEKLRHTLNCLTTESTNLLSWRYLKKLSYADIAQKMKILEKSCKQKMYRTKKEFIKHWEKSNKENILWKDLKNMKSL